MTQLSKEEIKELLSLAGKNRERRGIYVPYGEISGRLPDFEVSYEFFPDVNIVFQGVRCDFLYEEDDPKKDGVHMIWPEFLDNEGNVILDKSIPINRLGKATMWIGMHESRVKYHRSRLKIGTKGYWVAGSRKLAKVTVTKILGLFENSA